VCDNTTELDLTAITSGVPLQASIRHLLSCPECRSAAAPRLFPLLASKFPADDEEKDLSPELDAAYDNALDRSFATLFERQRALRESSGVRGALAIYAERGIAGLQESPRLLSGLAAYRTLLDLCQELRYEDPKRMVDAGFLAVYVAGRLSERRFGVPRVADWKCRALLELSNAYRVSDRLDDAERTLGEADAAFQSGTGDDLLKARLFDVRASLFADRRHFEAASEALDTVYVIYSGRGDRHLAGRALISKGIYVGYSGAPEEAIRLLQEGVTLIEPGRDPALLYAAIHNQAHFLLTCGRLGEARALLWKFPASPEAVGGRVNLLKMRWLAAQIDANLGELWRAEQAFLEVKRGFEEAGLYYKAALVTLEMATVLIRENRQDQARDLVVEVLGVFKVLRIQRESLGSLLLLDKAFEERVATGAMVEQVLELLRRAEDNPAAAPTLP
jgi:tetratricopeptide (TPR) repeat protein